MDTYKNPVLLFFARELHQLVFTVNIICVCLPSGKDFPSSTGIVSVLKKDVSAPLAATRSSEFEGEATDIFELKKSQREWKRCNIRFLVVF